MTRYRCDTEKSGKLGKLINSLNLQGFLAGEEDHSEIDGIAVVRVPVYRRDDLNSSELDDFTVINGQMIDCSTPQWIRHYWQHDDTLWIPKDWVIPYVAEKSDDTANIKGV
ncbi:MAG: hypothetical protein AAGD09_03380 [Cyanobacteria bacterium P01_F01_bin.56]